MCDNGGPAMEASHDDPGPYPQHRGTGRARANGAVAHAVRGPGQARAAGAAGRARAQGGGDRGEPAPACQDGPFLAQALQRPRPRRARGERAAGPPAGLPGGPGGGGGRGGVDAAGRPRPALRLLDARSFGRLPERGQGDRHAPQPHRRGPAARGAELAAGGDLVRSAGRSGLRQKKGAIERLSTAPPAGSAVVCLDARQRRCRGARKPARATPAAGS
jgi:hypothetical protein